MLHIHRPRTDSSPCQAWKYQVGELNLSRWRQRRVGYHLATWSHVNGALTLHWFYLCFTSSSNIDDKWWLFEERRVKLDEGTWRILVRDGDSTAANNDGESVPEVPTLEADPVSDLDVPSSSDCRSYGTSGFWAYWVAILQQYVQTRRKPASKH